MSQGAEAEQCKAIDQDRGIRERGWVGWCMGCQAGDETNSGEDHAHEREARCCRGGLRGEQSRGSGTHDDPILPCPFRHVGGVLQGPAELQDPGGVQPTT